MPKTPNTQTAPYPVADDRVLSIEEGAVLAGLSPSTLKRENKRGSLKFVRMSPRRVGVRRSELQRWLDACSS